MSYMANTQNLKQFFYCHQCNDFYEERGIVLPLGSYLTSIIQDNIGNCPKGHPRSIDKEDIDYLLEKPVKNANSSIICFDIKDFSKKNQIQQFNNTSLIHVACMNILSQYLKGFIYKGTGDGFIVCLSSQDTSKAIDFCESLIARYLKFLSFISYRIGIAYGSYFSYLDLNNREDFFGQVVIDVTRIANFGDNNTILLSKSAADILLKSNDARKKNLVKLGYCFDKHRKPYKVYNYKSKSIGTSFS